MEILAKKAGVVLKKSDQFNAADNHRKRLFALNNEISRFFHYILISHSLGQNCFTYLKNRAISVATIKEFLIGFAPENDNLLLTYLRKKDFTENEILSSGCFSKNSYGRIYNRFKNRLVFPLFNHRGDVCGFSGRVLPGADSNQAKYINSPETEIYHKSEIVYGLNLSKNYIRESRTCIVTEGEFDMISPFQSGVKNIVAVKGTAFTQDQLLLLHRFCDSLVLALDSDFAGNVAALRSIELADSMDFDLRVLDLSPRFKDPDEAIQKDPEFFKERLKNPLYIWDFIINSAVARFGYETPKGKKQVLANVLPFLAKIKNSVIQSDYFKKLASAINSDIDAVYQEARKISLLVTSPSTLSPPPKLVSSTLEKLEENLLILLFSSKKPEKVAEKIKDRAQFSIDRFKTIFEFVKNPQKLPPELFSVYQNIYMASLLLDLDSKTRHRDIISTLDQIEIHKIRQELNDLSREIGKLDEDESNKVSKDLEIRYNKLLVELQKLQIKK